MALSSVQGANTAFQSSYRDGKARRRRKARREARKNARRRRKIGRGFEPLRRLADLSLFLAAVGRGFEPLRRLFDNEPLRRLANPPFPLFFICPPPLLTHIGPLLILVAPLLALSLAVFFVIPNPSEGSQVYLLPCFPQVEML